MPQHSEYAMILAEAGLGLPTPHEIVHQALTALQAHPARVREHFGAMLLQARADLAKKSWVRSLDDLPKELSS